MGVSAEPDTASMNRTVLSIINQAEQSARISGMVRSIIREELCAVLRQLPDSAGRGRKRQ